MLSTRIVLRARPAFAGVLLFALALAAPAQPDRTAILTSPVSSTLTRAVERRAIVEGLTEPIQNLKVTDLAGRDIAAEVEPRTDRGVVTMNLGVQKPIVLKPRTIGTVVLKANERLVLPGGVIVPHAPQPEGGGAVKPAWFRLTLASSPMPAPWDPQLGRYVTRLTFGLRRPDTVPSTLNLAEPVIVKIDYQGLTATETATVTIEAPGLENEKTVDLHFTPLTAKPTLLVRSSISDVNLELTALPRLDVKPARNTVLGLGLDTVAVAVTQVLPDGRNQPVARDTAVVIEVSGRAQVDDGPLSLRAGEAGTRMQVRSAGLGPIVVRATADGVTGLATVQQRFPTGPLVAALVGGALGGLARRFVKGARRSLTQRRIVEGLVVATIAFVAAVLGVGYLGLPPAIVATEAGAFLTGALTAFAGVSVLETLSKKTARTSAG